VNRRGRRVREYYGFALIAGISHEDAEDMLIGYVLDMYMMRLRYDAKLAGARLERNLLG
jgi:hypothetical protein